MKSKCWNSTRRSHSGCVLLCRRINLQYVGFKEQYLSRIKMILKFCLNRSRKFGLMQVGR
ncbi:hypothetical protein Cantr_04705 [Candida viswanathii]|uniref:Uncharacterized protein n=1 Tax=Candida viswanathii TaxID=5486 RepID=A0A367XME4_9ASCO|nr:hypothetical protein Cantr_04705 [Candida viswanathii]